MPALAYTAAIQTRIAYALRGMAYSTLTADEKAMIDATWASGALTGGVALDALTQIQQIGQWFSLTAPTSVPDEWASWLVQRTVMYAAQQMAPDRLQHYIEMHDSAEMAALDAYERNLITYDPGATPEATTLTVQNLRYYVTQVCVRRDGGWETVEGTRRRRPRRWIPFTVVDAAIDRVIRNLWNRANWIFKRRQATLLITPYSITGGTFTHATKTITKTGEFSTAIAAGSTVLVTAGTGATLGHYIVASATASTVVLTASIGAAADGQTDIACRVVAVGTNLLSTETLHDLASREFYYSDTTGHGIPMRWATNDQIAAATASTVAGASAGRPLIFNFEINAGILSWWFYPLPDQAYTLHGFLNVKGPTVTTLAATTTALARFPREFDHAIRDAVVAEVLDQNGDTHGPRMRERSEDEFTRLLPVYAEPGKPDDNPEVRDVYRDHSVQRRGSGINFYSEGV